MKQFTHKIGLGVWGEPFNHPLIDEYEKRFSTDGYFTIIGRYSEKETGDILQAIKESLENGKPFFENAPKYIQDAIVEEQKLAEEEVDF